MQEFLREAGIATDSLTGQIALFLDGQRRRNRSRYARTITAIGTVIVAHKGLEIMQVQLAMNGAVSFCKFAISDYEAFKTAWRDAIYLMVGKWGTLH